MSGRETPIIPPELLVFAELWEHKVAELWELPVRAPLIGIWQYRLVSCQLFNIEGATCPRTYMVYIS
jgi:hypothetical protein